MVTLKPTAYLMDEMLSIGSVLFLFVLQDKMEHAISKRPHTIIHLESDRIFSTLT
jgi:hypothetical protein